MKRQNRSKKLASVLAIITIAFVAACVLNSPTKPPAKLGGVNSASPDTIANHSKRPGDEISSSDRFAEDQCTWYAAREFDRVAPWPGCNWGGNAGSWIANASAAGWKTFGLPAYYPTAAGYLSLPPGSIVVWTGGAYGHVAVLRSVVQNGIYIQEKNWPIGSGVVSRYLTWSQVLYRGSYTFRGYIPPWRR